MIVKRDSKGATNSFLRPRLVVMPLLAVVPFRLLTEKLDVNPSKHAEKLAQSSHDSIVCVSYRWLHGRQMSGMTAGN